MRHMSRSLTVLSLCLLPMVVACSTQATAESPTLDTDGVIIITSSHANVPVPTLSPIALDVLVPVLGVGLPVAVIDGDGTPSVVSSQIVEATGSNERYRARKAKQALDEVVRNITVLPNADGANAYGAFAVARDFAISNRLMSPTIICLMCGLDSTGGLDLTTEGALRAEPEDFLTYLQVSGQLVDFSVGFDNVHVIMTSTAVVAPPQEPLTPADQQRVAAIWEAVLVSGGATVTLDPHPTSGSSVETDKVVPTVAPPVPPTMPVIEPCTPQTLVFDGSSAARFEPEETTWVDEDAAREALRPLAEWLAADARRTVIAQGTTADVQSGDPEEGIDLSRRRAQAAADLLVQLGADATQIAKVQGLGPDYPGRVPDRDSANNPIPGKRTLNRKVILTTHDAC